MDIVNGIRLVSLVTGELREAKVATAVDDHSRYCVIAKVVERATSVAQDFASAFSNGMPESIRNALREMKHLSYPVATEDKIALSFVPDTDNLLYLLWCVDDIRTGTLTQDGWQHPDLDRSYGQFGR